MTQTLPATTGTALISDADLKAAQDTSKGEIAHPSLPKGSNIYGSTKIFPDYQAGGGESYFTLVHGIGADRVLFASDQPWGDFAGEHARLLAATGGGELTDLVFRRNFETLHGF